MDGGCTHPTKAGKACSAAVWKDQLCRWHHPDLESARRAGRIAGGKNRSNRERAKKQALAAGTDLSVVDRALCSALGGVLAGRIEPGVGTAAASIARAIIAIRQAGEMEERLARLEDQAGLTGGRTS